VVRWFGTNTDIHESKLLVESQQLLSRELNHRIKNIFSVVSGLVSFSAREHRELAPLAETIRSRISALGRAHDYVRPDDRLGSGGSVMLSKLLSDLVEPYGDGTGTRVAIEGEDLVLNAASVTPMALVFHELATNAVKYGALSVDDGRVTVHIRREGDEVLMDWAEQGGPVIDGPAGVSGFGSQLVDMSIRRQLGGRYERHWGDNGLRVAIVVPAGRI
jgi:two-component sensor histidine kinase